MKPILFISLLLIVISCNNNSDFYYGTWDLNKENGVSTLTLYENNTISWVVNGYRMLEKEEFKTVKLSPKKYSILTGYDKNCMKITMQKLSENQCVLYNYKCWINENMVDEVVIARKNKVPKEQIPIPEKEVIILPKDFEGDFFIVYQELGIQSNEIVINDKGIGTNQGEPDFKQLFNAKRIFRFDGQENNITLANPNGYQGYLSIEIDSLFNDEEVIVIQQGFNQSGRTDWNEVHGEKVKENLNIEYFEVIKMSN